MSTGERILLMMKSRDAAEDIVRKWWTPYRASKVDLVEAIITRHLFDLIPAEEKQRG